MHPDSCDFALWTLLVNMTNLNADRKRQAGHNSGMWHPVDIMEMQAFIGLVIITGIVRMPTLKMYWQTTMPLCNLPSFNETMPCNRFLQISRYLHVNDEAVGNPNDDKLYKVREFIDRVNKNFGDKYEMGCQISIDESLIPFKGRLSYRQFIPSKRARFGIKCWVLADAGNSFVSCFHIYTGRDANADADVPLSTRVVRQLVEGYENVHHQLYVDNFYTSPALFQWLLDRGIYACGTVRKGRVGFPRAIYFQRGRHERGTTSYLTCGDLLAQSWFDSKEVYVLLLGPSMFLHHPSCTTTITTWEGWTSLTTCCNTIASGKRPSVHTDAFYTMPLSSLCTMLTLWSVLSNDLSKLVT